MKKILLIVFMVLFWDSVSAQSVVEYGLMDRHEAISTWEILKEDPGVRRLTEDDLYLLRCGGKYKGREYWCITFSMTGQSALGISPVCGSEFSYRKEWKTNPKAIFSIVVE